MSIQFLVLGPLEATSDDRPIELAGKKQRLILGMLVAHAGERISCDRLIDAIWGPAPTRGTLHTLRVHVSNLRKLLDPANDDGVARSVIETIEDGYRLRVDETALDWVVFRQGAREGRRLLQQGRDTEAGLVLREALGLWRGRAFGELGDEPPLRAEAARLEELRLSVMEDRVQADLRLGHHGDLVAELRDLVELHPFRERLHGLLMVALYQGGRQAEALRTYRALVSTLGDELGITPGPEVAALEERILLQDPSLDPTSSQPLAPTKLPPRTTSFIGHEPG